VIAAATTVFLALAGSTEGHASRASGSCKTEYDYAGVQDAAVRSGIRAKLSTIKKPQVKRGHVGGWVGVGGPGLGPNKTDEWMQIGYSAFDTGEAQVYYEVALPDKPPKYHTVVEKLSPSATNRLSVLEVGGKNGSWRAWLNDEAVSPVTSLPQSHGKFVPQAIGETWNGGSTKCNVWGYGFGDVQVSAAPGGSWKTGKAGYKWENAQQTLDKTSSDSFDARSVAAATATPADRPPLLGDVASKLLGRPVDARCVKQGTPAREHPAGTLLLSRTVCELLLGYAVAQPYAPKPGSAPGLVVAETVLGYLRGVARASGAAAAQVDCAAVARFFVRTMRRLGATSGEAVALRGALLRARAHLSPPLSLAPGCPIR
jgi:hypothetical protein